MYASLINKLTIRPSLVDSSTKSFNWWCRPWHLTLSATVFSSWAYWNLILTSQEVWVMTCSTKTVWQQMYLGSKFCWDGLQAECKPNISCISLQQPRRFALPCQARVDMLPDLGTTVVGCPTTGWVIIDCLNETECNRTVKCTTSGVGGMISDFGAPDFFVCATHAIRMLIVIPTNAVHLQTIIQLKISAPKSMPVNH